MQNLKYLVAIVLICATAAVYLPVKNHEFISFDDNVYVTNNPHVKQGIKWESIKWAFHPVESGDRTYWHPVTWISHMFDCELFGVRSDIHHLINLGYHLLAVALLFTILLYLTGSIWKSAFAAALFALHPINVDSVAWIAERKNLLSTIFGFIAIIAYGHYARRPSIYRYSLIIIALALGLMAKSTLATLPCVLLLLDYWPMGRIQWGQRLPGGAVEATEGEKVPFFQPASMPRLILEKIPLLALSFASITVSILSVHSHAHMVDTAVTPMPLRISNAIVSYVFYLEKLVWPSGLAIFYPFPDAIPIWQPVTAAAFLLLVILGVLLLAKKAPYLVTGWLWYLGTLVPMLGLMQNGLWPATADRWAYMPLIGIFIIIAWGMPDLFQRLKFKKYVFAGAAVILLLLMGYRTSDQLGYWENSDTLFSHALAVTEGNFVAHHNLGLYHAKHENPKKARKHFKKSIEIYSLFPEALKNYADFLFKQGDYEKARQYYHKTLWLAPNDDHALMGLGNVHRKLDNPNKAAYYFSKAGFTDTKDAQMHNELGNTYLSEGKFHQALKEYRTAASIQPGNPAFHYNIGLAKTSLGQLSEALEHFREALKHDAQYIQAHLKIAEIMFQQDNMPQAQTHYLSAIRIKPNDESLHYNLGVVFLQMNHIEKALKHFEKALELNPGYEKAAQAKRLINSKFSNNKQ